MMRVNMARRTTVHHPIRYPAPSNAELLANYYLDISGACEEAQAAFRSYWEGVGPQTINLLEGSVKNSLEDRIIVASLSVTVVQVHELLKRFSGPMMADYALEIERARSIKFNFSPIEQDTWFSDVGSRLLSTYLPLLPGGAPPVVPD